MTAAVDADGIRMQYGALVAVDDLTFSVEPGEILGVLGPNGAGKTSAIRVLTTMLSPARGRFAIAGIPGDQPRDIRRRIGVLPESAGYPEQQSGEEFLRYHARLFGRSAGSARAVAGTLLHEVGLGERARTLIGAYSRGMRQRLGIARALVNDPEVVFLDEPTLGLDPAGQRQMLAIIRRLAEERGATVLLSTHLLAEVEETCTRVLIMNRGRVVAHGTVPEIARRAAAPRRAMLRVAPEDRERAVAALRGFTIERRPVTMAVTLDGGGGNEPLQLLLEAGVNVHSYELEAGRLSDAFLAMTEAG